MTCLLFVFVASFSLLPFRRTAIRAGRADRPDLVGLAMRGPKRDVDKATKGETLHG